MATLPQCPRCERSYAGTDFCPICRIADLEDGYLGLARAVHKTFKHGSKSDAGWPTEEVRAAMRNAEIVVGPIDGDRKLWL